MHSNNTQCMTRLHAASISTLFPCFRSNNMDVDDITIDSSANWKAVDRPTDNKEDEGKTVIG